MLHKPLKNRSYVEYSYEFYTRWITAKIFYYSYIKKLKSDLSEAHNLNKIGVGFAVGFDLGLEVGFLSFVCNPTPILPKMEAVEIMFSFILR